MVVMSVTPSRLQVVRGGQRLPKTTASVTICSSQQMYEMVEYLRFLCLDDTDAIYEFKGQHNGKGVGKQKSGSVLWEF